VGKQAKDIPKVRLVGEREEGRETSNYQCTEYKGMVHQTKKKKKEKKGTAENSTPGDAWTGRREGIVTDGYSDSGEVTMQRWLRCLFALEKREREDNIAARQKIARHLPCKRWEPSREEYLTAESP